MTVRIGLVIAAIVAAGLIAGVVIVRGSRSKPNDIADWTEDARSAPPVVGESVPAAAEPTPV
jgi:hypothetical protein